MDSIIDEASIITEEDRISNLPDDITYHIMSFIDIKYAIQTSMLSRKWKRVWTLMPQLNFNNDTFLSLIRFDKFVVRALHHRNKFIDVSAVELKFGGSTRQPFVADIVNYAYLRNLGQLTIWFSGNQHELPECLFVSHTLKHLTLNNQTLFSGRSWTPNSPWDFPSLETVTLTCIRFGDGNEKSLNLFSKCVKLKDMTLRMCSMKGVEDFNVCAPQLSSFTITEASVLPKVLHMVAPQLKTLTASASVAICSQGLASCSNFLHLSTAGFDDLEKVNISMSNSRFKKERHVPSLLELFRTLHAVKSLILDTDVIESLSSCLDQVSNEPCPFDNLKCLKINRSPFKPRDCIPTIPSEVKNYLLENSPNATFIMDLPQVPQKRPRQQEHNDTVTKVAKLDAEQELPRTIAEEKKMLEAKLQMQDQVNGYQIAKMRMQDQVIAQQKAKLQARDDIIAQHKAMTVASLKRQSRLVAKHKAMLTKMKMKDMVIAKLKDMLAEQNSQHEKLTSQIIKCKLGELKVQVKSGDPNYEVIRSVGRDVKSAMDLLPSSLRVNVEAEFSVLYEELKCRFLTRIDASQWARIETGLGSIRLSCRSHVHAAEVSAAPTLSPVDMTTSSRVVPARK